MWTSGWLDLKVSPGVPTKNTGRHNSKSYHAGAPVSTHGERDYVLFSTLATIYFQAVAVDCYDMSDGTWWVYIPPALTLSRLK
jgi:hypothetical protein